MSPPRGEWGHGMGWVHMGGSGVRPPTPKPAPARAGRPGGCRTYPWVLLGVEALPPFPGLLQGRIWCRGAAQQGQQQPQPQGHGTQLGATARVGVRGVPQAEPHGYQLGPRAGSRTSPSKPGLEEAEKCKQTGQARGKRHTLVASAQ